MASTTVAYRAQDGRQTIDVNGNKTLASADQGIVQNVIADAITITLPATVNGLSFTVRNGGVPKTNAPAGTGDSGTVLVKLAPNALDAIAGNGFTTIVNKAAQNTKLTAIVGDEITVNGSGTAGVTAWNIDQAVIGVWAKEA